jgi:DNA mismatch repair protein MutL
MAVAWAGSSHSVSFLSVADVGRIAVLAGSVADQIAAGEVVERPSSVVKELIENALDAGATSIDVTVEDGGRSLIRISDDGHGMDRDDALLALERHATSKIREAEDLVGIASYGFRGEALPAICSVSELTIETAQQGSEGTVVRAEGGRVVDVGVAARRPGTTVTVSRLFFNVPARRKFLRGARSEWRAISEILTSVALTRRDVRLNATHDGRQAMALPPASSLRARLGALWGGRYAESLVEVDDVAGPVHVSGLVERPADVGTATRRTHIVVNGRPIRDTGIVRAVETAYRSTIPSGVRPSLFLAIVLPAGDVDVNVHPAKTEVRFRDRWALERVVERAVRRSLGTTEASAALGARFSVPGGPAPDVDVEFLSARPAPAPLFAPAPEGGTSAEEATEPAGVAVEDDSQAGIAVPGLTQLRRTWMMFEHDEGIVLIDQHSAHERVLFEKFIRDLEGGVAPSQRLLFPLTMHLGPAEADAFDEHRDLLEKIGFEVEGFGGSTLLVRSVPMPHPRFDAERCLKETLDTLTGNRHVSSAPRHERLAATVACKAAIKAGDQLSGQEMRALFLALASTTLPAHDVHGRQTIVRLSWSELERRFGRA